MKATQRVFDALWYDAGQTCREIAERLGMPYGTCNKALNRLDDEGLAKRRPLEKRWSHEAPAKNVLWFRDTGISR